MFAQLELSPLHCLAVALGLGLLVGMQREWADKQAAGIRTFPLITMLGTLSGLLAESYGGWAVAAGVLGLSAFFVISNAASIKADTAHPGITTEVAALVMFLVGAALAAGLVVPALAVGGAVAVLLQWKRPLHEFVGRIGESDLRAITRFVLIALVILPALPNQSYGPYGVLNPFEIWLVVVLIVGISLGAYVAYKLMGARGGAVLAGILGGLISSTATTVSYSRRARQLPDMGKLAAFVIVAASGTVFARVLLEIAVVAPETLDSLAPPILVMTGYMILIAVGMFFFTQGQMQQAEEPPPTADLTAAVVFGALYAAVLFGVAAAKEHLGDRGLYWVAAFSGLTDVDAITLSTAQMVKVAKVDPAAGWRLILVGTLANLVFKTGVLALLGGGTLLWRAGIPMLLALAGGGALLLSWPS